MSLSRHHGSNDNDHDNSVKASRSITASLTTSTSSSPSSSTTFSLSAFPIRLFSICIILVIFQLNLASVRVHFNIVIAEELSQQPTILRHQDDEKKETNTTTTTSNNKNVALILEQHHKSQSPTLPLTNTTTEDANTLASATLSSIYVNGNKTKTRKYDICFVTCIFASSSKEADTVVDVTSLRKSNPTFHYILFTNLVEDEIQAPGWEIVLQTTLSRDFNLTRYITQSRYSKFVAWKAYPQIQTSCNVVFYMDGYTEPLDTPRSQELFHRSINLIKQNKYGLGQYPKTGSKIDKLASGLIKKGKDTAKNINQTLTWLRAQKDYNDKCTIYINRHFAYDPTNAHYQKVSEYFWNLFSKETGSWRDQLLWCYVIAKFHIKPLNLFKQVAPMKDLFKERRDNWGYNGHKHALPYNGNDYASNQSIQ